MMESIARQPSNDNAAIRREAFERALENIRRIKRDISALEDAVEGLANGHFERGSTRAIEVTPGGTIKRLDKAIEAFLRDNDVALSSARIAEALHYKNQLHLPFDVFKRRVVVTISAMAKKKDGPIEAAETDGEHVWRLKTTKATDRGGLDNETGGVG